jgi:hypothetical protein
MFLIDPSRQHQACFFLARVSANQNKEVVSFAPASPNSRLNGQVLGRSATTGLLRQAVASRLCLVCDT